jgi:methionine synthase II (cobalamin-independent)
MTRPYPPFRADQVGSLLRTAPVKEASEKRAEGQIDAATLKAVEDEKSAGSSRARRRSASRAQKRIGTPRSG